MENRIECILANLTVMSSKTLEDKRESTGIFLTVGFSRSLIFSSFTLVETVKETLFVICLFCEVCLPVAAVISSLKFDLLPLTAAV